jgi:hypothetical protein
MLVCCGFYRAIHLPTFRKSQNQQNGYEAIRHPE